jgi:pimeloyl-ACP methyl ester carboxylesterase
VVIAPILAYGVNVEDPVVFGTDARLLGMVTVPPTKPAPVGAAFLTAGLLHHVGPHRTYVQLARHLAARGLASIRFDRSGIGDSEPRTDGLRFAEASVLEAQAAMDVLQERLGIEQFVLIGICSGATQALLVAAADPRVVGVIAINPQSPAVARSLALKAGVRKLRRYYWRVVLHHPLAISSTLLRRGTRLTRRAGGGSAARRRTVDVVRFFAGLLDRGVSVRLIYSESELALDYLHVLLGPDLARLQERGLGIEVVRGADHVFSIPETQAALREAVDACLARWSTSDGMRAPAAAPTS